MATKLTKLEQLEELAKRLKAQQTKTDAAIAGKAPTNHASTATTYGAGSDKNYGHVKLSDATNGAQVAASGGTAATPKAVADALAAAKTYADGRLAANDAMIFKGTIGTEGTVTALPASGYQAGWTYRVITAGTYAGVKCEVGDLIICVKDFASAAADTDWTVAQTNIDGAVTGPASATDAHVAVFSGATGKVIKDSGFTIGISVPAGAKFTDTVYTHPASSGGGSKAAGLYKIATDANGHVSAATAVAKEDIAALGVKVTDTTYSDATTSVHGLMSIADKKKLDDMTVATDEEVNTMLTKYFAAVEE